MNEWIVYIGRTRRKGIESSDIEEGFLSSYVLGMIPF